MMIGQLTVTVTQLNPLKRKIEPNQCSFVICIGLPVWVNFNKHYQLKCMLRVVR